MGLITRHLSIQYSYRVIQIIFEALLASLVSQLVGGPVSDEFPGAVGST